MKKLAIILMAMFLVLPLTASATTLTFDEFPVGTVITTQYAPQGVNFFVGNGGTAPIIAADGAMSGTPVLSPNPPFAGDFFIDFVGTATNVSFDSGYWDVVGTGIMRVYDPIGFFLGNYTNSTTGEYTFNFGSLEIGGIWFDSFADPYGADIDNLTFDLAGAAVPEPSSLLLLGSGLLGLVGYGRKRMRK